MMNPQAKPDGYNLSLAIDERFSRSTDHSAQKNLGQGLVEACADGRSINLSCKARFILELCEEVARERTLDVVDNILKLDENGWIDITCESELVSGCVYTLCDHKRHVKAPRIAAALKPFIDREDMSEISREEFYKVPAARKLQLG